MFNQNLVKIKKKIKFVVKKKFVDILFSPAIFKTHNKNAFANFK